MSSPKPAIADDPVIAAIDNAFLDNDALTPEEAAEFEALVAAGGAGGKTTAEVLVQIGRKGEI
jgi:hypothetical protein